MNKLRQIPVKTWTDNIINRMIIAINQLIDCGGGGGGSIPVINNLTSTSTTSALSANMGRVLNGYINGKYTKPSTGVPLTDLAESIKSSLAKADTALQEHQDISGKQDNLTANMFTTEVKDNGIGIYLNGTTLIASLLLANDNNKVGLISNNEKKYFENKLNKPKEYAPSDMSEGWEDNASYTLENDVVTLNIPAQAIQNSINGILVFFHTASNFSSISYPNSTVWIGTKAPKLEADKFYLLSILNGYCSINEVSFQNPS